MTRYYTNTTVASDGVRPIESGTWEVVTETAKTLKLRMIVRPRTIWGEKGLCHYAKVGEAVTIKKDNSGSHHYTDWGDGTFTVYANRDGMPNYFKPVGAVFAMPWVCQACDRRFWSNDRRGVCPGCGSPEIEQDSDAQYQYINEVA